MLKPNLPKNFSVLKKCRNKFDCIKEHQNQRTKTDSESANQTLSAPSYLHNFVLKQNNFN